MADEKKPSLCESCAWWKSKLNPAGCNENPSGKHRTKCGWYNRK